MSLAEHFGAIWRRLPVIVLLATLVAVAVYVVRASADEVYVSTATVDVVSPSTTDDAVTAEQVEVVTGRYAALAETSSVLRSAVESSGLDLSVSDARALVSASSEAPGFVDVSAEGATPEAAEALATAVVDELATFGSGATDNLVVVTPAEVPTQSSGPQPARDAAFAFLLAFVVNAEAFAIAAAVGGRLTPGREHEEIETATGAPVIGEIPHSPDKWAGEAFRSLRSTVELVTADIPVESAAVVGVSPATGCSSVAFGLAQASANAKLGVALVEANVHRPALERATRAPVSPNLVEVIASGTISWDDLAKVNPLQPRFRVLPAGPVSRDLAPSLGAGAIRKVINALAEAELVIVDGGSMRDDVDALVVASQCDGALLVVDATRERRRAITEAANRLRAMDVRFVGTILNRTRGSRWKRLRMERLTRPRRSAPAG